MMNAGNETSTEKQQVSVITFQLEGISTHMEFQTTAVACFHKARNYFCRTPRMKTYSATGRNVGEQSLIIKPGTS